MGRPKGKSKRSNRKWTVDEKIRIVKRVLENIESISHVSKDESINPGQLHGWIKRYQTGGIEELGADRRGRVSRFVARKTFSREEQLEHENLLLKIENERLKKGYQVKGGGRNKEYVSTSNKSSKS